MNYGNNGYECGSFAWNLGSAGGISFGLYCEIKWKTRWETGRAGKKLSVCNRETDREIRDFTSGTKWFIRNQRESFW